MRKLIVLFVVFFCAAFVINCSNSGNFTQPIAYNHKKHVDEAGLSCTDCHVRVTTHRKASIPNIEVCVECHEEAMTESKEEAKVVAYIEKKEQIPWVQVHRVPDHAYFSHRRHVTIGKLDCSECHGNVAAKTVPFVKPAVAINMKFCLNCHKRKQANTDCAACHR